MRAPSLPAWLLCAAIALAPGCTRVPRAAPASPPTRVLFLGDSLCAGFGLERAQAFPAQCARLLEQSGEPIEAIEAGRSGDTIAEAAQRLPALLAAEPDVIVLEIGGNDGLRQRSIDAIRADLEALIVRCRAKDAQLVLARIELPRALGASYAREFAELYAELAARHQIALCSDFLEGVSDNAALLQQDGLHPTALGQLRLAQNLVDELRAAVAAARAAAH